MSGPRDAAAIRLRLAGAEDRLAWWREREAFARAAVDEVEATIAALKAELDGVETPLLGAHAGAARGG